MTMNNIYTQLWLVAVFLIVSCTAFSQNYRIQLCAFTETIEPTFFSYANFNKVYHYKDHFSFNHYYWGSFKSLEEVEAKLNATKELAFTAGLINRRIIKLPAASFALPISQSNDRINSIQAPDIQLFSRIIRFENKELSLKKSAVEVLEKVATILVENPTLKLRIIGNSSKTSTALLTTIFPPDIIEHFLLAKNIPAYRIKIIASNVSQKQFSSKQVILTLVDLKEEIVLDNFDENHFLVKKTTKKKATNLLE